MLGNSFRRKVVLLLLCSILVAPWASAAGSRSQDHLFSQALNFLKGIWDMSGVMPPQEPPRASGTGGFIPLSEAGVVMPPEDPPRPGSPGPMMENPNPGG